MTTESKDIADGVSEGLNKSKLQVTDRRLLVLFLFFVIFMVVALSYIQYQTSKVKDTQKQQQITQQELQKAQQQLAAEAQANKMACEQTNTTDEKFNKVLDQLQTNATNSTSLTPEQRAQALATYADLHLAIVDCSKLA